MPIISYTLLCLTLLACTVEVSPKPPSPSPALPSAKQSPVATGADSGLRDAAGLTDQCSHDQVGQLLGLSDTFTRIDPLQEIMTINTIVERTTPDPVAARKAGLANHTQALIDWSGHLMGHILPANSELDGNLHFVSRSISFYASDIQAGVFRREAVRLRQAYDNEDGVVRAVEEMMANTIEGMERCGLEWPVPAQTRYTPTPDQVPSNLLVLPKATPLETLPPVLTSRPEDDPACTESNLHYLQGLDDAMRASVAAYHDLDLAPMVRSDSPDAAKATLRTAAAAIRQAADLINALPTPRGLSKLDDQALEFAHQMQLYATNYTEGLLSDDGDKMYEATLFRGRMPDLVEAIRESFRSAVQWCDFERPDSKP